MPRGGEAERAPLGALRTDHRPGPMPPSHVVCARTRWGFGAQWPMPMEVGAGSPVLGISNNNNKNKNRQQAESAAVTGHSALPLPLGLCVSLSHEHSARPSLRLYFIASYRERGDSDYILRYRSLSMRRLSFSLSRTVVSSLLGLAGSRPRAP